MRRRTNIPILTRPSLSRLSVPGSGVTIITLLSKGVTFFTSFSAPAPSSRNAKKIVPTGKRLLSMFVNPTVVVIVDALLVVRTGKSYRKYRAGEVVVWLLKLAKVAKL